MTKDFHVIPVVGRYSVPKGYRIIEAETKDGPVAYVLYGGETLEEYSSPRRLELCMMTIAGHRMSYYKEMLDYYSGMSAIDTESAVINYDVLMDRYGVSEQAIDDVIATFMHGLPDTTVTNGMLISWFDQGKEGK